jgi:hypothetical protein
MPTVRAQKIRFLANILPTRSNFKRANRIGCNRNNRRLTFPAVLLENGNMNGLLNFNLIARHQWENLRSERTFGEHFGMPAVVIALVWSKATCAGVLPVGAKPLHLLWLFYWWKTYNTQGVCARFCGCDKGTFKKWRKLMENAIARLDNVSTTLELFASCY